MDIVLTIPKKQYERHNDILKEVIDIDDRVLLWVFKRIPKIEVGEYVHFVKNGRVEYYMTVIGKRGYKQQTLVMNNPVWHTEIIAVRGFQGFRYKWWEDES